MIYGITLIILGLLASPSILLSKKPDAQEILDKITPYQGWIGLFFCFWGLYGVFKAVMSMGMMNYAPLWWLTWTAASAIEAILGFILGYGMIHKYLLSKNEEAEEKGKQLLAKLVPIQGKLGLIGVGIGIWVIVAKLMFGV